MSKFNLCDEMLKIEILSRMCMTTLAAVRCTCTELDKLTYDPYFIALFKKRNGMVSGLLMQNLNNYFQFVHAFSPSRGSNSVDLRCIPYNSRIVASSDHGVVVFESLQPPTFDNILYHVCKPATQQVVAIPNPKNRYIAMNVAIVLMRSKPFHYKIIRISQCPILFYRGDLYAPIRCEVFDSRTWSWKMLDPVKLPFYTFPTIDQPITLSGSVYMLLSSGNILVFNAFSETWRIQPPPVARIEYRAFQLIKHHLHIGLACISHNGRCDIWLRDRHDVWANFYVLHEQTSIYSPNLNFDDPYSSVRIYSNAILFHNGNNFDNVATIDCTLFVYKSDFEPVDLTSRLEQLDV